jgi:uncharacterized protein YkwD
LVLSACNGTTEITDGGAVQGLTVEGIKSGTRDCEVPANEQALIQRLLDLVNEERTSRGLAALTLNDTLSEMAADYACDMIEGGFFDHVNPYTGEGPGQRAINAGYVFVAIGENLAGGQSSPEQAMTEWMDSDQGHRDNILAYRWREVGLAVRTGGEYGVYWVQEFGKPPAVE